MDRRAEILRWVKTISLLGTALFAWFVFESIQFLSSGQLMDLIGTMPHFFRTNVPLGLYVVFHVIMSTIGAFVTIPLMVGGRPSGLVLGVAYRLSGNTLNPLSFLLPAGLLVAQDNQPTFLAQALDILWLVLSLFILLLYYFLRRSREQTQ